MRAPFWLTDESPKHNMDCSRIARIACAALANSCLSPPNLRTHPTTALPRTRGASLRFDAMERILRFTQATATSE